MYCNEKDFQRFAQAFGCSMSWDDYAAIWGQRAARKIDELTLGRAAGHREDLAAELAEAECSIALILREHDTALADMVMLSSASNDGTAEHYRPYKELHETRAHRIRQALTTALGSDPYGLLYQGVG